MRFGCEIYKPPEFVKTRAPECLLDTFDLYIIPYRGTVSHETGYKRREGIEEPPPAKASGLLEFIKH